MRRANFSEAKMLRRLKANICFHFYGHSVLKKCSISVPNKFNKSNTGILNKISVEFLPRDTNLTIYLFYQLEWNFFPTVLALVLFCCCCIFRLSIQFCLYFYNMKKREHIITNKNVFISISDLQTQKCPTWAHSQFSILHFLILEE